MQKFIETIISAVKLWVKNDAFVADEALDIVLDAGVVEPLRATDGTIYTTPDGVIFIL